MCRRVITLLTDFGTQDYFVASMKGVILSINPEANIVDITHDVPPQDVHRAALILWACYKYFPQGTIHVVVVDPGVGTERRPILVKTRNYYFIGPDNGVLSLAAEEDGVVEILDLAKMCRAARRRVSHTFHGRDIFAPAAAYLSLGVSPQELGEPVRDYVRLSVEPPRRIGERELECRVIYIDRFGNVYTNIREDLLRDLKNVSRIAVTLPDGRVIKMPLCKAYGYVAPGEDVAVINSEGFLELAVNFGRFSDKYGVRPLDKLRISLEK